MLANDLASLPARGALGATMLYHGISKVRADGAAAQVPFFESIGLKPGARWVRLAGLAEVAAGASAVLGLGTRLAALLVLVTQGVAISRVHAPKGFENAKGGYEFNLLLIAVAVGLLLAGPGQASAHELVERRLEPKPRLGFRLRRPRGLVRAVKALK